MDPLVIAYVPKLLREKSYELAFARKLYIFIPTIPFSTTKDDSIPQEDLVTAEKGEGAWNMEFYPLQCHINITWENAPVDQPFTLHITVISDYRSRCTFKDHLEYTSLTSLRKRMEPLASFRGMCLQNVKRSSKPELTQQFFRDSTRIRTKNRSMEDMWD